MPATAPSMPTIGEIARRLGVSTHRVEYIIRVRDIRPCGWAGNARVFDDAGMGAIAAELCRIKATKNRKRGFDGP